jgi:predicted nucleic acid-binding protein
VSPPLAVIDTNVVVSGLLTARSDAPTARILDGMMNARFPFLLSSELLAEYRSVLLRPRVRSRHRRDEGEIEVILTALVVNARFRKTRAASPAILGGDGHIRALLDVEPRSVLVTGDRPLAAERQTSGRVLSPREFVVTFLS